MASSGFWVPPSDIRVRILGNYARRALYSHTRDPKALSHVDLVTPYDDQYWYVIPAKDQSAGQYLIKSAFTERNMYINPRNVAWGDVGTFNQIFPDQYLKLEQGQGTKAGLFRIVCPLVNSVLFSRVHMEPQMGCIPAGEVYDDQYFTFEPEPLDIVSVDYDIKNAVIVSTRPKSVFSQKQINNTNIDQDQSFKISETTEQQSTWEAEVGLEIGVSATFKSGIPFVAEAKVEVSAKVSSGYRWGKTNTTSQTWETTVNLKCPGGKAAKVTATVSESVLNVPFTTTFKSTKTGRTFKVTGIFKGTGCSDLSTNYSFV